jgi:hypothetical protein
MYKKKSIKCGERNAVILLQNENGPCPFLAMVNVLLLRNSKATRFIKCDDQLISGEIIIQNLLNYLIETVSPSNQPREKSDQNLQTLLANAIELTPKLQKGLDINIKFTGISEFEASPELSVFQLLNIPLVHGWLIDPQDEVTMHVMKSLSYNQAIEICTQDNDSSLIIRDFFDSTSSQLSVYGLTKLHEDIKNDELYVFFRNNHFSTIVKHGGEIYMLVTDQGYSNANEIVWEKYRDLGTSEFYKGNFEKYSYQVEKDAEYARSLQKQVPKKKVPQPVPQQDECKLL